MGLLSWLFPTPEDRMVKAEKLLADGEYRQARDELDEIEGSRAMRLRLAANEGLKQRNIEEAVACANAGNFEAADEHLDLAASFAESGDAELRGGRRVVREIRQEAKRAEKPVSTPMQGAAGGLFGGALGGGGAAPAAGPAGPAPEVEDPLYSLPPDDPRLRFALLLERYPEDFGQRMTALGPDFATAVLAIEDGTPHHAVEVLGRFVSQDTVARFQRARAASMAGMPDIAETDLVAFAKEEGGHRRIGETHTAVLLAGSLASQQRREEALQVLDNSLRQDGADLGLLVNKALLMEALGQFAEADEVARLTIRHHPRTMVLYKLMARCRLKAGKRMEAMQVLEAGLTKNCASGKCGSLPFDVEAGRMLAQLYLEDREDPQRARELLTRIKRSSKKPGWFDAYLEALLARNEEDSRVLDMVKALGAGLQRGDPRIGLLREAFPGVVA